VKTSSISVGIIIPAYQPSAEQLKSLIFRIDRSCRNLNYRAVLVDDGSESRLVLPLPISPIFKLLRHQSNQGKGMALMTGFEYLQEEFAPEVFITLDADLQHPPEYIPDFVSAYARGLGKIIIGSRKRNPRIMPFHRILSNTLTSLTISLFTGQLVKDSQCGFRLISSDVLRRLILQEKRFHLESELLIKAGMSRIPIASIPIPTIYSTEKSSIKHWRDTLNFGSLIIKIIAKRIRNSCMNATEI
jgi:glycosyltransferase involved in cell wall biosynthesis